MFSEKMIFNHVIFDLFLPLSDDGDDNIVRWGSRALEFSELQKLIYFNTPD